MIEIKNGETRRDTKLIGYTVAESDGTTIVIHINPNVTGYERQALQDTFNAEMELRIRARTRALSDEILENWKKDPRRTTRDRSAPVWHRENTRLIQPVRHCGRAQRWQQLSQRPR